MSVAANLPPHYANPGSFRNAPKLPGEFPAIFDPIMASGQTVFHGVARPSSISPR